MHTFSFFLYLFLVYGNKMSIIFVMHIFIYLQSSQKEFGIQIKWTLENYVWNLNQLLLKQILVTFIPSQLKESK